MKDHFGEFQKISPRKDHFGERSFWWMFKLAQTTSSKFEKNGVLRKCECHFKLCWRARLCKNGAIERFHTELVIFHAVFVFCVDKNAFGAIQNAKCSEEGPIKSSESFQKIILVKDHIAEI